MNQQGFVYPSILKDNNLRETESADGGHQHLRMVTQPANSRLSSTSGKTNRSSFSRHHCCPSKEANSKSVISGFRGRQQRGRRRWGVGRADILVVISRHTRSWAMFTDELPILLTFLSETGAALSCLLESSGRKALLLLLLSPPAQPWALFKSQCSCHLLWRVTLDQVYTPSLTEWTTPSLYSTFH